MARNEGLISADRNDKATLLLTIPRSISKSSTKDSKPNNIRIYDSARLPLEDSSRSSIGAAPVSTIRGFPQKRGPILIFVRLNTVGCYRRPSRRDSGLEAFSHNPADDSFSSLSVRINEDTKYPNQLFLSY